MNDQYQNKSKGVDQKSTYQTKDVSDLKTEIAIRMMQSYVGANADNDINEQAKWAIEAADALLKALDKA